jgi:hypothetical protein
VIQPGGSIRDEDVIKAADEAGLAMDLHRNAPLPPLIPGPARWEGPGRLPFAI